MIKIFFHIKAKKNNYQLLAMDEVILSRRMNSLSLEILKQALEVTYQLLYIIVDFLHWEIAKIKRSFSLNNPSQGWFASFNDPDSISALIFIHRIPEFTNYFLFYRFYKEPCYIIFFITATSKCSGNVCALVVELSHLAVLWGPCGRWN